MKSEARTQKTVNGAAASERSDTMVQIIDGSILKRTGHTYEVEATTLGWKSGKYPNSVVFETLMGRVVVKKWDQPIRGNAGLEHGFIYSGMFGSQVRLMVLNESRNG